MADSDNAIVAQDNQNITIDPNGDAILTLKYPSYELQILVPPPPRRRLVALLDVSLDASNTRTFEKDIDGLSLATTANPGVAPCEHEASLAKETEGDSHEFHHPVSSQRLCDASPFFENIFNHDFLESKLGTDGKYHFSAEDLTPMSSRTCSNVCICRTWLRNQRCPSPHSPTGRSSSTTITWKGFLRSRRKISKASLRGSLVSIIVAWIIATQMVAMPIILITSMIVSSTTDHSNLKLTRFISSCL